MNKQMMNLCHHLQFHYLDRNAHTVVKMANIHCLHQVNMTVAMMEHTMAMNENIWETMINISVKMMADMKVTMANSSKQHQVNIL
ncbi:hypothetical protein JG664_20955, partial [Vibrio cholerae]|nr:hypothetical protein [Vibrio cholerae]